MLSKITNSNALNKVTRLPAALSLLLLLFLVAPVFGATVGKEAGSPAGSYALSGFDSVSLFSGNLNFNLPMLSVGGRGDAGTYLSLNIQRNWGNWKYIHQVMRSFENSNSGAQLPQVMDIQCQTYWDWLSPTNGFMYRTFCTNKNNTTAQVYVYDITWNNPFPQSSLNATKPGYGPGILRGHTRIHATQGCSYYDPTINRTNYNNYSQRPWQTQAYLTFTEPDGTEHEFVDQQTHGSVYTEPSTLCDATITHTRGTVWVSTQDTATTFIADAALPELMAQAGDFGFEPFYGPTGQILKKDGTRYRIDGGLVTWTRDRNGNRTDFTYDSDRRVKTITDSLGRLTTVNYDVNDTAISPDGTPYGLCDQINYKGFNEAQRTIRVTKTDLSNALADGYTLKTTAQLWPNMGGGTYGNATSPLAIPVVSGMWLPDGRSYKFLYNSFAELARVELPTGGAVEYTHDYSINETVQPNFVRHVMEPGPLLRRVAEKREYTNKTDPDSLTVKTTFGNVYPNFNFGQPLSPQPVVVDQRDKNNNLLSRSKHYFIGHPLNLQGGVLSLPPWNNGLEKQTETISTDGQTVRRIDNTWEPRIPALGTAPALDIHLVETKTTYVDSNLVTKQRLAYDDFNNPIDTWDYDFGIGVPPLHPARHVHTDYLTTNRGIDYTDPNGPHISVLPCAQQMYSVEAQTGVETLAAQSETKYDETSLLPWYGDVQSWGDPSLARGNPTTSRSWLNTTNGWLETRAQYDQVGNVTKSWDAMNNMSEVEYSEIYHHAYPTKTSSPVPDSTGTNGSAASLITKTTYDFSTGLVLTAEDAKEQVTAFEYDEPLSRLARVIPPSGGNEIIYEYGDAPGNLYVKVKKQLDENVWDEGFTYFDGLGRTIKIQSSDAQGYMFSETVYDALGRVSKSSSPYRAGEQKHWVETIYDDLGRVKEIISPKIANEAVPAKVTSEYSAATTGGQIGLAYIGINQAGKRSRSITNALGQLIRVDEPDDAGDLGPINNPTRATYYKYDALGNLSKVTQGDQARHFLYDSLGRLLRVRQPEQDTNPSLTMDDPVSDNNQWSTGFTYDSNGNVKSSTDAKGVTTNYNYDKLNRVTQRDYTIPQTTDPKKVTSSTTTVTFKYDGQLSPTPGNPTPAVVQFAKGALTETSNGVSTTQYTHFDNLGRLRSSQQIVDGQVYPFGYTYNMSGALIEETYPSGRVVTNTLDAGGDLSSVSSHLPNQSPKVFASDFRRTADGDVDRVKLGNGKWETHQFNARKQITQIGLGTSASDTSLWRVNYEYGRFNPDGTVDVTKNDGNVLKQTITVLGVASPFVQTYGYDSLNRLTEAKELSDVQQTWKQTFSYDRYGNRIGFSQIIGQTQLTLNNVNHPSINPLSNRFQAGQGYEYDLNGNLIQDAEGRKFAFDGDNKQREVKDSYNNTVATYAYDGGGRRVKKTVTATQEVTVFVYDANGKLAAEYSNVLPQNPTTRYITADILDTPRVITDGSGNVISRKDYMPFGEELYADRSADQKYGLATGVRQSFTGYEKDDETQFSFAEARYYNPPHGRFTTVDPLLASGTSTNPQSFNRYVYAGNNPTLRVDPNGEDWFISRRQKVYGDGISGSKEVYQWQNRWTPGRESVRSHVIYSNAGATRGWVTLDRWEPRFKEVASPEKGVEQFEAYRRQAVLNYVMGAAEAVSFTLDMANLPGVERDSEMFRAGQNSGIIISALSLATGVGLANQVLDKFGKGGLKIARRALPVLNNVCFVAGTQVHTDKGLKAIEEIKVGDKVLSWDEHWKRYEYKSVARTFEHRADALVKVRIRGERAAIVATPEHPFYARVHRARDSLSAEADGDETGEWVGASSLQAGDELLSADGEWAEVIGVEREEFGAAVYNFEVEDNHNYFVGERGILVHNQCSIGTRIANGHSFVKHFLEKADMSLQGLGIRTRQQFAKYIDDVITKATGSNVRNLSGGRTAYWDDVLDIVIIHHPSAADGGTAFRPAQGRQYFNNLK